MPVRARGGVASVCVLPGYLARCAAVLTGSEVRPSTTVGFPHGAQHTRVKVAEAKQAIRDGAVELDMVINLSQARSGDWGAVRQDIQAVLEQVHAHERKLKVILETCYLGPRDKLRLCDLCSELGADWVKTSTGFGPGGATVSDVRQMRARCPSRVGVKASGGIRSLAQVCELLDAGADRIGTSHTAQILAPDHDPTRKH